MSWCPDVRIYTQKSTRIWKVYISELFKMYMKVSILLYSNQTLGVLRLYGDSRVSPAQPRINAFEILLQYDWLLIFSKHNRFAETHSHLQLSYHITNRLLAAGNNYLWNFQTRKIKWAMLNLIFKLFLKCVNMADIHALQFFFSKCVDLVPILYAP